MNASPERRPARPPGESANVQVRFRDPPSAEQEAAALRTEIAKLLVRAPSLPVPLPAFGLTLLDLEVDRRTVALVVGPSAPIAKLRIGPRGDGPVAIGAKTSAVKVELEAVHPDAQRFAKPLNVMASRLEQAITEERWAPAMDLARRLRALPVGVPLGFFRQIVAGVEPREGLVRTGFNCNQDCGICWQGREWGKFGPEQILTWIEDLYEGGARALIISGGEPTLDKRLEDYVRRARELGYRGVTLETNAIQFARPGLAERLRDAGVTTAFVSLHSGNPEVSDRITRAPGTHDKTVKGIQALLAAGVPVRLNAVMTGEGLEHLAGLPDFLHQAFGGHPLLKGLMLSCPTQPFDQNLVPEIVPDPRRLREALPPAIDRAFALGIQVTGLDGPCGPPLCAFGADRRITKLRPVVEPLDFRHHLPGCEGCAVRQACFGVRTADLEIYGEACIEPITTAP